MARIALAVGGAAAGFLIAGPLGAQIGATAGSILGGILFRPHPPVHANLQDLQVSSSANGAPIPFGYGTCRLAGQVIWCPGIHFTTKTNSQKGGPSSTTFFYYANFAAAFGEGPATISRIWGDAKLIWSALPGDQSDFPPGSFPPWSATTLYNPGNLVSYQGQVFQCVTLNTGKTPTAVIPHSGTIYWELASNYPTWQLSTVYQYGQVVNYQGQLWVVVDKNGTMSRPPGGGKWKSLADYYGSPTFYPGTQTQSVDPDIQASETASFTPAFRGLCYLKWLNLPLLNFGNRIPNLRAEVTYLKVANVL